MGDLTAVFNSRARVVGARRVAKYASVHAELHMTHRV